MKFWFISFLFVSFVGKVHSQLTNYNAIQIPLSETYSSSSIAKYISINLKTDREKIEAAYSWVTANISYDKDSMYNINWGPDASLKVSAALRRKKGVCENFAAVFTDILLKSNIPSFVVNGYTIYSKTGHGWSAVKLDNQWFLCDPTWDIGVGNTRYFLIPPIEFIDTHIPFDPLWQLLPYPHTYHQYNKGKPTTKTALPAWDINDSVSAFLQLDSLQQFEASALRMQQTGTQINTLKTWQAYTKMKIAIVYGDKDKELYNAAVADFNKATTIFNNFVTYRNNQFTPAKPANILKNLLADIPALIESANNKINQIGQTVANEQYDTGGIKNRLDNLLKRVMEQEAYLEEYIRLQL